MTIGRELWRAPVIQLLGGQGLERFEGGTNYCQARLCRSGVRTKLGINMGPRRELLGSRLSKEERIGPGW